MSFKKPNRPPSPKKPPRTPPEVAGLQKQIDDLLAENSRLDQKLSHNSHSFKDVLIYCKKTIEKQDEQIHRLDDMVRRSEAVYENKLKQERERSREELADLKTSVDKLTAENLLMKTQLGNQEQMELEMKELRLKIDMMRRDLESKQEKIGKRELKERELVIVTTEKVRRELEAEFAQEIEKVKKELQLQNQAQIKANQQIVRKVQSDLVEKEKDREHLVIELGKTHGELDAYKKAKELLETEKKRLEMLVQKAGQQTERLLKDSKRQLEDSEKTRAKELQRHAEIESALKKQREELQKSAGNLKSELATVRALLEAEKKVHRQSLETHRDQNTKLHDLRTFLQRVLEENDDEYIDTIIGENRSAVFAQLSLLIQKIPTFDD
ncbi:Protein T15B7.15 [Aphelenchoides avenae]|nr:Protein T15B7.15 [Aphelenchus avenae]